MLVMPEAIERELITEEWLKSVGFKWEQYDRQSSKMWTLWLGSALVDEADGNKRRMFGDATDVGIEVSTGLHAHEVTTWSCFLRSDTAGRYHRFIHLRYLLYRDELVAMIEAITGQKFIPENCFYGAMEFPEYAERRRAEQERLDRKLIQNRGKWSDHEKDDTRGRATSMATEAAIKGGLAK